MDTRTAGRLTVIAALSLYAYYTVWVLVTPFVEPGQPILRIFPPRYFAIASPVFLGVLLFGVTAITLGCFLLAAQLSKLRARRVQAQQTRDKEE